MAQPRVFVTGAAGRIGVHTIGYLREQGYVVKGVDLRLDGVAAGAHTEYALCDVNDAEALAREMRGCDAVLHLAAIPLPWLRTPAEIYRINCHGTLCVYQAAAEVGIRRVVCASSINALGCWFGQVYPWPRYLPLDEEHPGYSTDIYSFSKEITEETAAYFHRRDGISSLCVRMGGRMGLDPGPADAEVRAAIDELLRLPGDEGSRRIAGWIEAFFAHRREHPVETYVDGAPPTPAPLEPLAQRVVSNVAHLWTALDIRDRAVGFERALVAEYDGAHALFLNDAENCAGVPSPELAALCYPGARLARELRGAESLISIDRAREMLGWEPRYSVWREGS